MKEINEHQAKAIIDYMNECNQRIYTYDNELSEYADYYLGKKWAFVDGLIIAGLFNDSQEFILWINSQD